MKFLLHVIIIFLSCSSTCLYSLPDDKNLSLDELALLTGTDKSSNFHGYTGIYDRYFSGLRHTPIKLLEIGIYKGRSVALWDRYFDHEATHLHFIDIVPSALELCKQTRVKAFLVNQENKESLNQFIEIGGGQYDIIIDDGGHTMNQQKTSFEVLFPALKNGGMYIIEDLHTSYWKSHGGGTKSSTVHFLFDLIHDLNYVGAQSRCANFNRFDRTKFKNVYQEQIESILFHCSLCIIVKRDVTPIPENNK